MSENICNVMTPFADVAELGQGYMGRADGERLWVPLPEPAEVEGDVAFVIYLVDGTPAFAGSGRCIQVADQGEGVDPQVRFEALLDSLAFDERSQPVYDYIVAVRAAAEQAAAEAGGDAYAEDEAPAEDYAAGEDEQAAEYAAVSVDQTVEYGTENVAVESAEVYVDDGFAAADAYGQPEGVSAEEREDQTPVGEPDAGPEADADHAAQSFGEHAAWSGEEGSEGDAYGEELSEMPVHTASDAPENTAGEGFTDPGFAEPALLEPATENTAPGGGPHVDDAALSAGSDEGAYDAAPAYPEAAIDPGTVEAPYDAEVAYDASAGGQPGYAEGAYDPGTVEQAPDSAYAQQAYEQGGYEAQGYGEEEAVDALELPAEMAGRVTPSARPAEAAIETVMTPSIMPIATGILSRPAIALHFQPVRAKGPARSAATGLFEYPKGELPVPTQLPMPAGY